MSGTIPLTTVESSQLHSIGHDPKTNTLAIRFRSKAGAGSLYHYSNFTADDFAAFQASESKGSHFKQHIKPFADKYPYTKVSTEPAEGTPPELVR